MDCKEYYEFETKRSEIAALARIGAAKPENVPSDFPSFSSDSANYSLDSPTFCLSFWNEFTDDTPNIYVAAQLLQRQGWDWRKACEHVRKARGMESFGKLIKSMRRKVFDYKAGRIPHWHIWPLGAVLGLRLLWENVKDFAYLPVNVDNIFDGEFIPEEAEWRGQDSNLRP